jgi:uncharacterized membrane protein
MLWLDVMSDAFVGALARLIKGSLVSYLVGALVGNFGWCLYSTHQLCFSWTICRRLDWCLDLKLCRLFCAFLLFGRAGHIDANIVGAIVEHFVCSLVRNFSGAVVGTYNGRFIG